MRYVKNYTRTARSHIMSSTIFRMDFGKSMKDIYFWFECHKVEPAAWWVIEHWTFLAGYRCCYAEEPSHLLFITCKLRDDIPFFCHLIVGIGVPAAWHLSCTASPFITVCMVGPKSIITGGTTTLTNKHHQFCWIHKSLFLLRIFVQPI